MREAASPAKRPCVVCQRHLPPEAFRASARRTCIECFRKRDRHRQRAARYGISEAQFVAMLAAQDGRCAICDEATESAAGRALSVDHDHATKAVRGLLCHPCNILLGMVDDDPQMLLRAILYLAKHGAVPERKVA